MIREGFSTFFIVIWCTCMYTRRAFSAAIVGLRPGASSASFLTRLSFFVLFSRELFQCWCCFCGGREGGGGWVAFSWTSGTMKLARSYRNYAELHESRTTVRSVLLFTSLLGRYHTTAR